jgi:hypothetical protein
MRPAHFHGYRQFQEVVTGSGTLGTHQPARLMAHYARQRKPYDPMTLWYRMLRPPRERTTSFMPASNDLRDPANIPRYEKFSTLYSLAGPDTSVPVMSTEVATPLPESGDGLAAWLMRLAPHGRPTAPALPGGSGRLHVVVGGNIVSAGQNLDWVSLIWSDPRSKM